MKNKLFYTLVLLILLTIGTALVSHQTFATKTMLVSLLLLLASIKIWLVAFYFMELRKAHPFWKVAIVTLTLLIVGGVIIAI